jgi:DNA-directed RNA polymerase specialized sigma24 family protein
MQGAFTSFALNSDDRVSRFCKNPPQCQQFRIRLEFLFRKWCLWISFKPGRIMKPKYTLRGVGATQFHTTRWTLVIISAQSQAEEGRAALAELCQLYWYPLYSFVRVRGYSPHDAQDLTQGFFLHLLEHRALTRVDRMKGKFRSFLLASFKNYLSVEAHRARSLKRGGKCEFVSLDLRSAENPNRLEPADPLTPEKIFDARWAIRLLGRAMTLLGDEYAAQGKSATFETLKVFLRIGDTSGLPPQEEAAKALGVGLGAVKTMIHRLRKRYSAILRQEIGRTVSDPAEIDGEIHALCDALIAAEGA